MHGPYSEEMSKKLMELDSIMGYLIDKLQSNHLYDKLNLIVTSDHGMEATSANRTIFLDKYVNVSLFEAHGSTTIKNIFLNNRNFHPHTIKNILNSNMKPLIPIYKKAIWNSSTVRLRRPKT